MFIMGKARESRNRDHVMTNLRIETKEEKKKCAHTGKKWNGECRDICNSNIQKKKILSHLQMYCCNISYYSRTFRILYYDDINEQPDLIVCFFFFFYKTHNFEIIIWRSGPRSKTVENRWISFCHGVRPSFEEYHSQAVLH